ncbi:serine/threonine protein kinase [Actinomadura pelletieri DSM 43383]|uniref:Serine/threonine protein kinase n=1 Tax=Actinomadura pelletieri DSM 43383 TaxID=1120940 RepID=A0A495QXU3_9ACTN|nr:serine/threonine-protein kinase [Actinomadura pelletieri]RKS78736.1 serine/threonine protein kinase [Actinomadura pelletieri DSM 43383]
METGEVLEGGYRVLEPHRTGGMGELWLAQHASGTRVMVKTMRSSDWANRISSSVEAREALHRLKGRFARERRLLEELDHPAIPRLLDHGVGCDGIPYMVMEYIAGTPLDTWQEKHTVTDAAAASILVPLLEALAYAHGHRVVHRDVKPANMIIDEHGRLHVIDFGIAFVTDPEATRYTYPGLTPGSAGYKAPELINGEETPVPAADVYSAGCVAYLLFAGKLPYSGQSDVVQNTQHLHAPVPRIRSIVPHVPEDVDDIVFRMMRKKPADRPTIPEAVEVLRRYLPGPDSPVPNPAFTPDPTVPYRDAAPQPPAAPVPPRRSRRGRRPGGDRPVRAEFARLLSAADDEIANGEAGPGIAGLTASLARASDAWGRIDESVALARLRLADMDVLRGDCTLAASRYREVVRDLQRETSAEARALVVEAQAGIAECHLGDDELEKALDMWETAVRAAHRDPAILRRVRERLRRVADELRERQVLPDTSDEDV